MMKALQIEEICSSKEWEIDQIARYNTLTTSKS